MKKVDAITKPFKLEEEKEAPKDIGNTGTTVTNEYRLAVENYDLSEDEVLGLVMNGFKSAFLSLKDKTQMVDQVLTEFASQGAAFSGEISRRRRSQI